MGLAMARDLIAAGLPTTVWDRSMAATAPLSEAGAVVAVSPRLLMKEPVPSCAGERQRGPAHETWG
jgi:3-hydroxyisobutyrate dehydrogenase-like beta-hydroxyacid dehydrogenase